MLSQIFLVVNGIFYRGSRQSDLYDHNPERKFTSAALALWQYSFLQGLRERALREIVRRV
jgi:hypothetical protein